MLDFWKFFLKQNSTSVGGLVMFRVLGLGISVSG